MGGIQAKQVSVFAMKSSHLVELNSMVPSSETDRMDKFINQVKGKATYLSHSKEHIVLIWSKVVSQLRQTHLKRWKVVM